MQRRSVGMCKELWPESRCGGSKILRALSHRPQTLPSHKHGRCGSQTETKTLRSAYICRSRCLWANTLPVRAGQNGAAQIRASRLASNCGALSCGGISCGTPGVHDASPIQASLPRALEFGRHQQLCRSLARWRLSVLRDRAGTAAVGRVSGYPYPSLPCGGTFLVSRYGGLWHAALRTVTG
ncbi:hypothetical protein L1887_55497 [Cichorium endivia]|nr:hypothetical protein L1887_55497 [Cichorium endivia]